MNVRQALRAILEEEDCKRFTSAIVFRKKDDPEVLLIKRGSSPEKGKWACPGGHAEEGEDIVRAAKRESKEETGITITRLTHLDTVRAQGYPSAKVYFYYAVLADGQTAKAGDDAASVKWQKLSDLGKLAFDNQKQIKAAAKKLKLTETESPLWLGSIRDGEVKAVRVPSAYGNGQNTHANLGVYGDWRWRFREDSNVVFWWGEPPDDAKTSPEPNFGPEAPLELDPYEDYIPDYVENEVGRHDWQNNWDQLKANPETEEKIQQWLKGSGAGHLNAREVVKRLDALVAANRDSRWLQSGQDYPHPEELNWSPPVHRRPPRQP